jgi:Sec-independent protein translocase protein TatA
MSLAALFDLGRGEVVLILTLVLILLAAKRFPEITEGFRQGIKEFRKATRELIELEAMDNRSNHPVLVAVTFALGVTSLIPAIYEYSK